MKRLANREMKDAIKNKLRSGYLRWKDLSGLFFTAEPLYALSADAPALVPGRLVRIIVAFRRRRRGRMHAG